MSALMDKIKALPSLPGCYIYKNKDNEIIYIGKSKCLKKRVRQYFVSPEKKEDKIKKLVKDIYDFDYIITATETDALLLECKLIKEHMPYYNTLLKRTKAYPFINISLNRNYPGIYVSYQSATDIGISFGCFYNADDARHTIKLISTIWHTPLCMKEDFDNSSRKRGCLNMHLGKCTAPCVKKIPPEEYKKKIKEVIGFLKGEEKRKISELKKEMLLLSKQLEFEKALLLRDRLFFLEELRRRTRRFNTNLSAKDFIVFLRAYHESCFSLFYIRDGEALIQATLPICDSISAADAELFINAIVCKNYNVADGKTVSMCITSIGADKLYLDVTSLMKRKNKKRITQRIIENYKEFYHGQTKTPGVFP